MEERRTIIEEKRGLMGRKTSSSKGIVCESSIETAISRKPKT